MLSGVFLHALQFWSRILLSLLKAPAIFFVTGNGTLLFSRAHQSPSKSEKVLLKNHF
jgi:hypothetical protein